MKTPLDSQIYVPFFIQEPDSSTIDNLIYNNGNILLQKKTLKFDSNILYFRN